MAVRHGVTDTDKHFIIDPVTRTIINESGKLVLIQYDHNSERFTFECPRYVDDHDMSLCNRVEIHFINTGLGDYRNTGVYEIRDLKIPDDNSKIVTCSWLISQQATQYVGKLNFVIRFACTDEDGVVEYAWNTGIYSDIAISKSIYNSEDFLEDYIDVLEMWKQDLYAAGLKFTSVEQTTTSTQDGGVNVVTMTMTDGSTRTVEIRNGSKGSKGDTGTSITSIAHTSGTGAAGTTDIYTITMSNGSTSTFKVYNGKDARSITSVKRTSGNGSEGTLDTYTITFSDNTTSTFQVYNGADGSNIASIARTSGTGAAGTTDTYTVTLTDGTKSTFQVYNGADGKDAVSISSIKRTSGNGAAGTTDTYTVTLTDGTKSTFQVYNGADGNSIRSIARTSGTGAAGTADTYTITFSDTSTFNFRVYNGADGKGSGDMLQSVYDPQNKNTDVFAYVDNKIGDIDFPTSMTPTAHDHSASEITSGTLPIARGGTGATDADTARTNLGITPANIGASATGHKHTKSEISDFPTSMPASDVADWAKAASKPTYTAEEVGAASTEYVDSKSRPVVTTAGTGAAFTATVPGITSLTAGASFLMVPHTESTSKTATLNVNGLGAKSLKRHTSNVSSTLTNGYADSWLSAGTPVEVIYNGTYWIVQGMTQTNPHDLSTAVPITKGGTGVTAIADTTYTTARYRASALFEEGSETDPTTNGVIHWTYA